MTPRRRTGPAAPVAVASTAQQQRRYAGPVTGKGQTRRTELLLAARRVFERKGFLDARVADIVEEARVAQGTFYTYFDDKDAVFEEVARAVVDEMLVTLRADTHPGDPYTSADPPHSSADPYSRMAAANRRFVNAYRPNARILALIEQVGSFTPAMRVLRLALRQEFVDRTARGIRELQNDGQADPDVDPAMVAEVLGTMVEHTCYVWLILGKEFDEGKLLETLTDVWARAIGVAKPDRNRALDPQQTRQKAQPAREAHPAAGCRL
jgi:AcrR family transcriptional regulator